MSTSKCQHTLERLAPYVDEELPAPERTDIDRHLEACGPCREIAAREQAGRKILREGAVRLPMEPLPPGLRARCDALARENAARTSRTWVARMVPAVVGGVLVLVIGVALLALATRASDTVLAAQLAADHAKCFSIFAAAGAQPVDAHGVEQMLASSYGWDIHVPPSSEREGVQLVGGRRCLYGEGRIPHLMYKVHGQNLSLYVLEGVARGNAELSTFGQHSRIWSRGTNTFVLVSQAGRELDAAARYVMQEAR